MISLSGYLSLITALMLCGIGVFIFSRNPKAAVNCLFAGGMLALAVADAARFGLANSSGASSLVLWQSVVLAANVIMLPVWHLFSLTFGAGALQKGIARQRRLAWVVGIASLFFLGLVPTRYTIEGILVRYDGSLSFSLGWAGQGLMLVSLAIAMVVLCNLEMTFRHANRETRQRIRFLALGLFGILGFHVFWLSRTLLHSAVFADAHGAQALVHLVAGGLMVFSLVRHRLLDVDVFISRYVVYRSLTLLLIGAYLVMLGFGREAVDVLGFELSEWTSAALLIAGSLTLAALLLSEGFRRRVKIFIDTHFYKNKYDYRKEWLALTERLARAVTIEEVVPRIIEGLLETMWVEKAGIYVLDEGRTHLRLAFGKGLGFEEKTSRIDWGFLRSLVDRPDPIDVHRARSARPGGAGAAMLEDLWNQGVRIAAPMVVRDEILGLLVVGSELSGQPPRPDDYDLCRTVAAQAATVIMNARLAEDLAQGREIRAFAEMASFLIHDIKNCVHTLSLTASNAENHIRNPAFQQDMIHAIRLSVEKMQGLLRRLTGLRQRAVRRERVNLNDLIRGALQGLAEAVPDTVRIETFEGLTAPLIGDVEQLEGVIRNLTVNAIDAIEKDGHISIRTFREGPDAVLIVSDNGRGMSPEFMTQSLFRPFRSTKGGLGIGLYQCKQVTEAHGGRLEVRSVEGRGTTCILRLPIDDGAKQSATTDGVMVVGKTLS